MPIGNVWICCLLFVCFFFVILCVCTVTDFSAKDKASGVKFAWRFIGFLGRESPQETRNQTNRQPLGSKVCYGKAHSKHHARDAPFVEYGVACGRRSACVDIGQSPLTYLLCCDVHIAPLYWLVHLCHFKYRLFYITLHYINQTITTVG